MPRPLHAYTAIREDRLPADVITDTLQRRHPAVSTNRPPSPLVSFLLSRVSPQARLSRGAGSGRPYLPGDLVGSPIPERLRHWSPRFRRGAWPRGIAQELYDRGLEHISPAHFAMGCFPRLDPKGSSLVDMVEYPGVPELYMWVHGLELDDTEMALALDGMRTLLHDPLFIIWAANPDPDHIPRSFARDVSPLARLRMFHQLKTNPLSIPMYRRPMFLDLARATPEHLLELPRRPRWTPRSRAYAIDPGIRALQVARDPLLS